MTTYIVSFEVENKDILKEKLKEYVGYCPIHDNCWAILSEDSPLDIVKHLTLTLSEKDRVFVMRSGTYSAWNDTYGTKNTEWLQERL